jgi:hypothetical protein
MRLRVQNIGGLPITGATITDNLNPNFEYVGNPAFYTSNTWNTPCNPPIGQWAGRRDGMDSGSEHLRRRANGDDLECEHPCVVSERLLERLRHVR